MPSALSTVRPSLRPAPRNYRDQHLSSIRIVTELSGDGALLGQQLFELRCGRAAVKVDAGARDQCEAIGHRHVRVFRE